mmetsp:Transcript_26461/g.54892  ORF Transcript_26461/g.54892 Transcript_26461/m.54892 type:complete len:271 (-) Transcript_26461:488-1300(-)
MCLDWAAQGECERSAAYMLRDCPQSCAYTKDPGADLASDDGRLKCELAAERRVTEARVGRFEELQQELREEITTALWQQNRLHREELERVQEEARVREALLDGRARAAEGRAGDAEAQLAKCRDGEDRRALKDHIGALARDLELAEADRQGLEGRLEESLAAAAAREEQERRLSAELDAAKVKAASAQEERDLQLRSELDAAKAHASLASRQLARLRLRRQRSGRARTRSARADDQPRRWVLSATWHEALLLAATGAAVGSSTQLLAPRA